MSVTLKTHRGQSSSFKDVSRETSALCANFSSEDSMYVCRTCSHLLLQMLVVHQLLTDVRVLAGMLPELLRQLGARHHRAVVGIVSRHGYASLHLVAEVHV